eukprot:m.202039 g.202039  ORF g.202039 m.202039 type:complete len:404 (+) comp18811_c0_seq5:81-1292(+)
MVSPLAMIVALASVQGVAGSGVGGVKFRNTANRPMRLFWVSHKGDPDAAGRVGANGGQTGFMTYETHKFFWAEDNVGQNPVPTKAKGARHVEFEIKANQRMYAYIDDTTNPQVLKALNDEVAFMEKYQKENGIAWVGTAWPRPAPTWPMWRPTHIGQKIHVPLDEYPEAGRLHCEYGVDNITGCYSDGKNLDSAHTWQSQIEHVTIEVVSITPRVFRIVDFLSDFEADYIIQQAAPMLGRSTVGHGGDARESNTRSSKSAWLHRGHSKVLDAIYQRVGLVARVPEGKMVETNVESINVLNYGVGAEYAPHFDWGADGRVESRFISSLIYLNTPEAGGGTGFPKAIMGNGKVGTEVNAEKRTLVFFYDLLEDGNADELSLHAGLPVKKGEKWIAPLWIWEPKRR